MTWGIAEGEEMPDCCNESEEKRMTGAGADGSEWTGYDDCEGPGDRVSARDLPHIPGWMN